MLLLSPLPHIAVKMCSTGTRQLIAARSGKMLSSSALFLVCGRVSGGGGGVGFVLEAEVSLEEMAEKGDIPDPECCKWVQTVVVVVDVAVLMC